MKKFEGKKILFLGTNVGTSDMIRYAKENGAISIVADNLPKEKSLGKQMADKDVMISTGDLEGLKDYITKEGVKGVLAGISEFNLLNAMKLCQSLSLPFYCNKEQWDMIENKDNFRRLCVKYGVPTPTTFFMGETLSSADAAKIHYPVIVKPVDGSSSIGITICRDKQKLQEAIGEAKRNSESGRIIIEEFAEGEEFAAHYTIANGIISLSSVDNRVPVAVHDGDVTTIPVARVYPSTFIHEYISQVNPQMLRLCQSLGMNTGILFIQGLYNKVKKSFYIFEAGLRCAGEAPYRLIERINGISFMNNIVDYALLGKVEGFNSNQDDPFLKGKICCVTSFVSKGGKVGKILNYDNIFKMVPSIVDAECRYPEGDDIPRGNTLRQIMLRFVLICDSKKQLIEDVEKINHTVKVFDDNGEDMCLTFDAHSFFEIH